MNFNFELLLTIATFVTGVIYLIDICYWAPQREQLAIEKPPQLIEYARSFFPILLVVLILRSFLAEPFRIPSGSEKPVLLVGDFIVTSKFAYGVRLPVLHTKVIKVGEPSRGDLVVFRYPEDNVTYFVKRVVGLPGDRISYINKVLYINGVPASQQLLGQRVDTDEEGRDWPVELKEEDLLGLKHEIYVRSEMPAQDFSIIVPPGEYFMMGDNRDGSNDSRYWGTVPEQNLVGKALWIWFSWDGEHHKVLWDRIGKKVV